jgi:hypothetical protein
VVLKSWSEVREPQHTCLFLHARTHTHTHTHTKPSLYTFFGLRIPPLFISFLYNFKTSHHLSFLSHSFNCNLGLWECVIRFAKGPLHLSHSFNSIVRCRTIKYGVYLFALHLLGHCWSPNDMREPSAGAGLQFYQMRVLRFANISV